MPTLARESSNSPAKRRALEAVMYWDDELGLVIHVDNERNWNVITRDEPGGHYFVKLFKLHEGAVTEQVVSSHATLDAALSSAWSELST